MDAGPPIVFVIFICVFAGHVARLRRRSPDWPSGILPMEHRQRSLLRARSKQILCDSPNSAPRKTRIAHLVLYRDFDPDRLVQVDGDGPAEAAALGTCAERVVKTEKTWRCRSDYPDRIRHNANQWKRAFRIPESGYRIDFRERGSRFCFFRFPVSAFRYCNDVDFPFRKRRPFRLLQLIAGRFSFADRDAVLNHLHDGA